MANPSLRMRNESSYSEPGGSSSIVFVGNWKGKYMQKRNDSLEINCLINCYVSCLLSLIIGQVLIEANFEVSKFFPSFVDPWGSIYLNGRSNSPENRKRVVYCKQLGAKHTVGKPAKVISLYSARTPQGSLFLLEVRCLH